MEQWLLPFQSIWDIVGFLLFLLVFPVYHSAYAWLARSLPNRTARSRVDALRKSWIERMIARGDVVAAAQQTRNLTMVNSILVSSALLLLGFTVNLLIRLPQVDQLVHPSAWDAQPGALQIKLYMLIVVFATAFSFFMTALRHLGHFVLIIGADPKLVESYFGSAAEYFSDLINRASHRYTLGVRSFYAAFPLLVWLFDSRLFVLITAFWAVKFMLFQDFSSTRVLKRDPVS